MNLERIMLVDDEADIRQIARLALEALGGFTIQECPSGLDAPALAHTFQPQLILMDVMMPGQDGPTTFKMLRADLELPRIPVIFMTAKVQPQEIEQLLRLGALEVIPKPFDPMALADTVRKIWQRNEALRSA